MTATRRSAPLAALLLLLASSRPGAAAPDPPPGGSAASPRPPAQGAPGAGGAPPPPPPAAQDPALPVTIDVTVGFGGKVAPDGFAPVFFELASTGPGRLVTVTLEREETRSVVVRLDPLELEDGVRRRVVSLVPARALNDAGTLTATATGEHGEVLGQSPVYPESAGGRLLLILDRRGATPADLSALRTLDGAPQGGQPSEARWTTHVVSRLEDLPQSPLGYTSAAAVLLGDLQLEAWSEGHVRALSGWLARGGHLLVSVGDRGPLLRRSGLGQRLRGALAPLLDAEPRRAVDLGGLLGHFGLDEVGGLAPAVARLLPGPADVAPLRERGTGEPLVVKHAHGLGSVTLLGFDVWQPPCLHSPVTGRLLEALLTRGPTYQPRARDLFDQLADMRQPAGVGSAFGALMVYALVAGPGVYFLLRARGRGILVWVAIPAITLATTLLVPLYRVMLRDAESSIVGVRLIEARAGEPVAVETVDLLLFSGGLEDKRLECRGEDVAAFGMSPARRGRPFLGAVLGTGSQGVAFTLPVALWGSRYVSFERTGVAPAVSGCVAVAVLRPEAHISIQYGGRAALRSPVVVFPSPAGTSTYELERDLPPGGRIETVALPRPARSGADRDQGLGARILADLLPARFLPEVEARRTAYLIGETTEPFPVHAVPNVRVRAHATIVAIELPVAYLDALPFGAARVTRELSTVAPVESGAPARARMALTRIEVPLASLAPGGGPARVVHGLRLRASSRRSRTLLGLAVEGYVPATGEWRPIAFDLSDRDTGAQRALEADVPDASAFVSDDGVLLFRQRYTRPRQEDDDPYAAQLDVAVEWTPRPAREETAPGP